MVHPQSGSSRTAMYFGSALNSSVVLDEYVSGSMTSQLGPHYVFAFLDECERRGLSPVLIGNKGDPGITHDGRARTWPEHRGRSIFFYVGLGRQWARLARTARREQAEVLVVTAGAAAAWWPLRLAERAGIPLVMSFHCTLWPRMLRPDRARRVMLRLHRRFLGRPRPVLGVSQAVIDQIDELGDASMARLFRPIYEPDRFAAIPPVTVPADGEPLRVLYANRVEEKKGVFDMVAAAQMLHERGVAVRIDLCGPGAALAETRRRVEAAGLTEKVLVHGHVEPDQLVDLMAKSHAVVVPTRTTFAEGLAKSAVEGVLAGRPVVTCEAVPAVDLVREATIVAEADNAASYAQAFEQLANDPELLLSKARATTALQAQFYDPGNSWGAQLAAVLDELNIEAGATP